MNFRSDASPLDRAAPLDDSAILTLQRRIARNVAGAVTLQDPKTGPALRVEAASDEDVRHALAIAGEARCPVVFGDGEEDGEVEGFGHVVGSRHATLAGSLRISGRALKRVLHVDRSLGLATVEPGFTSTELRQWLLAHAPEWSWPLSFGAGSGQSIGALVARNALATRSFVAGGASGRRAIMHRVAAIDALLVDGTAQRFGPFGVDDGTVLRAGRSGELISSVFLLARERESAIRAHWPAVDACPGYPGLDAFAQRPGFPRAADGSVNLAHLLCGSMGALAWSRAITLRLQPVHAEAHSQRTALVLACRDWREALDHACAITADVPERGADLQRVALGLATAPGSRAGDWSRFCSEMPWSGRMSAHALPAALLHVEWLGRGAVGRSVRAMPALRSLGPLRIVEGADAVEPLARRFAAALAQRPRVGAADIELLAPVERVSHWCAVIDRNFARPGSCALRGDLASGRLQVSFDPPVRAIDLAPRLGPDAFTAWPPHEELAQAFATLQRGFDPEGRLAGAEPQSPIISVRR